MLERLAPHCVQPDAVVLRRAKSGDEIARVPLGKEATARWGAPYLVCHRSDLQRALLETAQSLAGVAIVTGAKVTDFEVAPPRLVVERDKVAETHEGQLIVAADGVWSAIRAQGGKKGQSRFIGQLAWRRTLRPDDPGRGLFQDGVVTACLSPAFHLIAYPMRGGREMNLVAFTKFKRELAAGWNEQVNVSALRAVLEANAPALAPLAEHDQHWTAYPIHVADLDGSWSDPGGLALIGDAAHAMSPFAAQGAAMAIEDAETLASAIAGARDDLSDVLTNWQVGRRRRVLRVARRGALNQFAWHAAGPVAVVRDMFLKARGPDKLAADMDWLYGWKNRIAVR